MIWGIFSILTFIVLLKVVLTGKKKLYEKYNTLVLSFAIATLAIIWPITWIGTLILILGDKLEETT